MLDRIYAPKIIRTALMTAALTSSPPASALIADSLTLGNAKALALAHAVTADPPGIDSIHFNPAGLARIDGRKYQVKGVAGSFTIGLEFGDYVDERKQTLESLDDGTFPKDYFDDEAHNATSETEGATVMLPFFGMTDLPVILAALGGASYSPPGKDFTVATNVYAPAMLGYHRAEDDPGRWIGERLSIMHLTYFSPSIGINVTEDLALGAAITFNYVGIGLELPFRSPHIGLMFLGDVQNSCAIEEQTEFLEIPDLAPQLCQGERLGLYDPLGYLSFEVEKNLVPGFNFGVLWNATEWLTLGATYIASFPMDMQGDYTWTNSAPWIGFLQPFTVPDPDTGIVLADALNALLMLAGKSFPTGENLSQGTAKISMDMPEQIMLGASIQLTPSFKINIDYKFSGWSAWDELAVEFSEPIDFLRLAEIVQPELATRTDLVFPLGLEDTWNWALGFEYQYSDNLVLRFGVEDRPTSLADNKKTPLIPIGDGTFYGAGFGMKLEGGAVVDFGVGYMNAKLDMPGNTSPVGNDLDPLNVIYNPYAGTDIKSNLDVFLLEVSIRQDF